MGKNVTLWPAMLEGREWRESKGSAGMSLEECGNGVALVFRITVSVLVEGALE